MKRMTDRRAILLAAGTAVAAAATGTVAAQPAEIHGTVAYEQGAPIPKGQIEVYLDDPSITDSARIAAAKTSLKSDGGSSAIEFTLPMPGVSKTASPQEIVAVLQRADGWLLARGSAVFTAGEPVQVTLYTAMY